MLGSNEFQPERRQHAPDPSLEEMLRRARAAHLGDTPRTTGSDTARFAPLLTVLRHAVLNERFRDCALLVIGIVIGVLITSTVVRIGPDADGGAANVHITAQPVLATSTPVTPTATSTPLPIPTDTPAPTATTTPIVSLPTFNELISLAKNYYDNVGPFDGSYVLTNVTDLQIQSQADSQLTVCVAYEYAMVSSPNTIAGTKSRTFTLTLAGDNTWQVTQLDAANTCSLT